MVSKEITIPGIYNRSWVCCKMNILVCDNNDKANNSDSFMSFLFNCSNYKQFKAKNFDQFIGYHHPNMPLKYFPVTQNDIQVFY